MLSGGSEVTFKLLPATLDRCVLQLPVTAWTPGNMMPTDRFPAGLRVMIVDDDQTCLRILETMLKKCRYEVTKCNRAEEALSRLREQKTGYDIVISDVHMPDMDGFKLLEYIGLEMDLPVLMMSADDSKSVVMKGVIHGAVDYLIKPLRMDALKNIWQHVVRRRMNEGKDVEQCGSAEEGEKHPKSTDEGDNSSSGNEGSWRGSRKRKEEEEEIEDKDDNSALKKPRVVWSVDLHQQFVGAVNQLGIDKAVPKKILELMNIPGLTRENVASHLQKYRLYLKRVSGVAQTPGNLANPFLISQDATYGALSTLSGMELHTLASTQVQPHNLPILSSFGRSSSKSRLPVSAVDQRALFSFDNAKLRFKDDEHMRARKQADLLHRVSMSTDTKQMGGFHHPGQSLGSASMQINIQGDQAGPSSSMLMQMTTGQVMSDSHVKRLSNHIAQPILAGLEEHVRATGYQSHQSPLLAFTLNNPFELSGNPSSLESTQMISGLSSNVPFQEEINLSLKEDGAFAPTYDGFNDVQKSINWDFQNVGMNFGHPVQSITLQNSGQLRPAYAANQAFPFHTYVENRNVAGVTRPLVSFEDANAHIIGHISDTHMSERCGKIKIESSVCPEQLNQDLMNAVFKQYQGGIEQSESDIDFENCRIDNNVPL